MNIDVGKKAIAEATAKLKNWGRMWNSLRVEYTTPNGQHWYYVP